MVKGAVSGDTLAENTEVTSGLRAFKSVANGPGEFRDSPFGRPAGLEVAPPSTPLPDSQKPNTERAQKPGERIAREPKTTPRSKPPAAESEATTEGKFTEHVTVRLSPEMRQKSEELARVINRRRSVKGQPLTRNSLIRVALQCFLDEFMIPTGKPVNSEAELLEAVRSRRKK